MRARLRLVGLVSALLVLAAGLVVPPAAHASEPCIHIDVKVSTGGTVLTDGFRIADDGGFGHAGTGLVFTFQARIFPVADGLCGMKPTDPRTWEVSSWPCENLPRPAPVRSTSLTLDVALPLDCELASSPGLFGASLSNGKSAAGGSVFIYSGAPGWTLPHRQARGLFGPFAMQADPVNTLTGALAAVETDAAAPGLGIGLSVDRAYNSSDPARGAHGPGWRTSYSDHLTVERAGAALVYHAADGRDIRFTRAGAGPAYTIERGAARFAMTRSGSGYVLTTHEQQRMSFGANGALTAIRDRNGQGVTVAQTDGRVVAVRNGRRALRHAYDDAGLLTSVTLTAPGAQPRVVRYATDRQFQRADQLHPGDQVGTADGRTIPVDGLRPGTTRTAEAFNLTVDGLHTYHVLANRSPVLVHNAGASTASPTPPDLEQTCRLQVRPHRC